MGGPAALPRLPAACLNPAGAGRRRMGCEDSSDPTPNPMTRKRPMTMATRSVTLRDFFIFQLKLVLDGFKDLVVFNVSIVAVVLDFLSGRGRRPRLFYSVLRLSERFDLWLNLHGVVDRLEAGDDDDGLFGASEAGSDTLVGKLEELVRGGDEPRSRRRVRDPEE